MRGGVRRGGRGVEGSDFGCHGCAGRAFASEANASYPFCFGGKRSCHVLLEVLKKSRQGHTPFGSFPVDIARL